MHKIQSCEVWEKWWEFFFLFLFLSFLFFFFFGSGKKNQRGQISACLGKCIWKMEDKERMVKSKKYLWYNNYTNNDLFPIKAKFDFPQETNIQLFDMFIYKPIPIFFSYLLSLSASACTLIKWTMWTMIIFSSRDPCLLNIENHGAFTSCSTHSWLN